MSGAWVFKDTRLPVATVFENLEDMSVQEVMDEYEVTREQIEAVLGFVAQSLKALPALSSRQSADEVNHQRDDADYQQQVNESASNVE